jgi:hypothetical protein
MVMDEEVLDNILKSAICDRLEGWELVEFLNIPIEDIVELFEEEILDNVTEVKDFITYGIETETDETD